MAWFRNARPIPRQVRPAVPNVDSCASGMAFNRNVFINCPFDDGYRILLRPLLFTVYRLGFQPRIALESRDSGRPRIDKLVELIRESQYAIHDLSRIQATNVGDFFRLNMPFELGVDF